MTAENNAVVGNTLSASEIDPQTQKPTNPNGIAYARKSEPLSQPQKKLPFRLLELWGLIRQLICKGSATLSTRQAVNPEAMTRSGAS